MIADDLAAAAGDPATADRPALVHGETTLGYAELWRRVAATRTWLAANLAPGSRVAVILENSPELVIALYGATAAGMVAVPIDATIHPRNLDYLLADSEPAAVVTSTRHLDRVAACAAVAALRPRLVGADGMPAVDLGGGAVSLEAIAAGDTAAFGPLDPDLPALISYTTGTSGLRKGALLSHRALAAAARNINAFMQLTPGTVELVSMPITHSFGFGRLRCAIAARGTAVLESGLNRPAELLETMAAHRVTSIGVVPMACRMLLDHYRDRFAAAGATLRFIELGSDFLDRRYKEALVDLFPGARICMHYGLTEASRSTFIEFASERVHLDTIGRATPNVDVAVRDEAGAAVGPDQPGEICIRGETVMLGYWRKPELTAEVLRDGWLHTGDLATRDRDGYLRLLGRRSEVFKVAGFSVAPQEVESVLVRHPQVADAAVAPRASGRSSAVQVTAFIVPHAGSTPDPADLKKHCRAELESYKVPSRFVLVESLPRTASGKLQRRDLPESVDQG